MLHEMLINKDDADVFGSLIPQDYKAELKKGRLYGIATFDDKISLENLVGVVLVRVKYQWQEIVWVAVTDRYSLSECAADLIRIRTESARERGLLLGSFSEFPVQEVYRLDYFSCAGFFYDVIPSRVFQIYTKAIMNIPDNLSESDGSHCFRLKYISERQKNQIEEDYIKSGLPIPLEYPVDWEQYDGDASVLYEDKGIVKGALFICKHDDFYSIEGIYGTDAEVFGIMFMYLNKISKQVLAERELLLIPSVTETVETSLRNNPKAFSDEIALVWIPYESSKKRKSDITWDHYSEITESYLLGIDLMNVCENIENSGILADEIDEVYYYAQVREREAVYERHWNKIEDSSKRMGLPPIILIQQKIAQESLAIYKSGKAESFRMAGYDFFSNSVTSYSLLDKEEFTRPPVSVDERKKKAELFASLLKKRDEIKSEMKQSPGDTIQDHARYSVNERIIEAFDEALDVFFATAGIKISTGGKISFEEQMEVMKEGRSVMATLTRLTSHYHASVAEEMIGAVRETDGFKKELDKQVKKAFVKDKKENEVFLKGLKETPGYKKTKDKIENVLDERIKLLNERSKLTSEIEVLCCRKEFEGYKDVLDEIYSTRLRTINFYIRSTDAYLKYLSEGQPVGAMQGVYIRDKFKCIVPCPDPNVRFKDQMGIIDQRFQGLAPWEMDGATIFLAWERMQERLGKTDKDLNPDIHVDIEGCRNMLETLEKKKNEHPELFREMILTSVFSELPELVEIFNEAKRLRNASAELLKDGFDNLDEKYDIYIKAGAIYDTLLRRARYVVGASEMTMKELIQMMPDYQACDYGYALNEYREIAKRR